MFIACAEQAAKANPRATIVVFMAGSGRQAETLAARPTAAHALGFIGGRQWYGREKQRRESACG
jgi:hypothetical protein